MAMRCFARAGVFTEDAARVSIGFREVDLAGSFAGDFFCTAMRAAALDVGFCLAIDLLPRYARRLAQVAACRVGKADGRASVRSRAHHGRPRTWRYGRWARRKGAFAHP